MAISGVADNVSFRIAVERDDEPRSRDISITDSASDNFLYKNEDRFNKYAQETHCIQQALHFSSQQIWIDPPVRDLKTWAILANDVAKVS